MTKPFSMFAMTCAALLAIAPISVNAQGGTPLTLSSAKVSIAGTSNVHDFTASTTDVRVTKLALANGVAGPGMITAVLAPGAVTAFEIVVKAATLTSPKQDIDKNMLKALKTDQHPEITFRLLRFEGKAPLKAIGQLKIAGVEREVSFDIKSTATGSTLTIAGDVPLVMTDYGIAPPKAMMGMLKTDPKITVSFEVVMTVSTTY